jgi:structural maintenance of chromosome 3 (chondroitin sulfate proteoglycan 6)
MKDSDRLNLLKEVAGTTVYEERRQESIKILQDTASKQDRIAEILEFIEQRLQELEGEKDELKQYEELDKRRRALEYNLYDKDLAKATSSLEIMEQDQEEKRNQQHELYAALRKSEEKLQTAEDELASLKDAIEKAAAKRASKGSELADLSSMRSRCEVDLQEAEARLKAQQEELQRLRAERDELIRSIQLSEAELAEAERKVSDQSAELSTLKQSHGADVARIEALYGKQGRGRQFSSAKERDVFLRNQVALVEGQLTEKNDLMQRLSTEIAADQSFINTESRSIKSAEALGKERQARSEELSRAVDEKLQHRNSAQERRKHLWRELEQVHNCYCCVNLTHIF